MLPFLPFYHLPLLSFITCTVTSSFITFPASLRYLYCHCLLYHLPCFPSTPRAGVLVLIPRQQQKKQLSTMNWECQRITSHPQRLVCFYTAFMSLSCLILLHFFSFFSLSLSLSLLLLFFFFFFFFLFYFISSSLACFNFKLFHVFLLCYVLSPFISTLLILLYSVISMSPTLFLMLHLYLPYYSSVILIS